MLIVCKVRVGVYKSGVWGPVKFGALDGGVLILHVDFKKAHCRPVEFKKCPCPMSLSF